MCKRMIEETFNCDLCNEQITDRNRAQTTEHTVICLKCIDRHKVVSDLPPIRIVIEKKV